MFMLLNSTTFFFFFSDNILFDLSSAFGTVAQPLLLETLLLKFQGNTIFALFSYDIFGYSSAFFADFTSSPLPLNIGVSQGPVMLPFLPVPLLYIC